MALAIRQPCFQGLRVGVAQATGTTAAWHIRRITKSRRPWSHTALLRRGLLPGDRSALACRKANKDTGCRLRIHVCFTKLLCVSSDTARSITKSLMFGESVPPDFRRQSNRHPEFGVFLSSSLGTGFALSERLVMLCKIRVVQHESAKEETLLLSGSLMPWPTTETAFG